jgi:hypothetical protein
MSDLNLKVLSRHDSVQNEKCPKCLNVFQHFMDLDGGKLGCYKCGTIFVSKPVRDYNYSRIVEQMKAQQAEKLRLVDPVQARFLCAHSGCRFEAKTKAGLKAHQRRCKNV